MDCKCSQGKTQLIGHFISRYCKILPSFVSTYDWTESFTEAAWKLKKNSAQVIFRHIVKMIQSVCLVMWGKLFLFSTLWQSQTYSFSFGYTSLKPSETVRNSQYHEHWTGYLFYILDMSIILIMDSVSVQSITLRWNETKAERQPQICEHLHTCEDNESSN